MADVVGVYANRTYLGGEKILYISEWHPVEIKGRMVANEKHLV